MESKKAMVYVVDTFYSKSDKMMKGGDKNGLHKTSSLGTKYCADGRLPSKHKTEWKTL
jgi:hypothetical protein